MEDTMLKTIAVGTDGSPTAARAVEVAIDMAKRYDARLVVGSCYEPIDDRELLHEQQDAPQEIQWSINPTENVEAILRDAEDKAKARGLDITSEARMGRPAKVLCEIAKDHEADLLVVGNRGMERKVRGSVPNSVSHSAPCSVMIVKTS
jgi:nucleotide-binding universal stress UspA family protein